MAVHHDCEEGRQTCTMTDRVEIAVEIRDDPKSIALPQRLQDRPIARESSRRSGQETRRYAPSTIGIAPIFDGSSAVSSGAEARQFGFKIGGQRADGFRQSGFRRQASDERAIGG